MLDANERAIDRYLVIEDYAKVGQIISGTISGTAMLVYIWGFIFTPRYFTQGLEGLCFGVPLSAFAIASIVRWFAGGFADSTKRGIFDFNPPESQ